ncbi:helix-turn-helix transcriptional regulator [Cellulosimicrobium cellulans]|uniref:helix-turn-helix transcriptional regulator n=1 Tax=Cellulosimicrobium cellulans TaxID=1710 RepID=UPI0036E4E91C
MDEFWDLPTLARAATMSRAHLTRLFARHVGIAPMRYLAEIRLTEFARLVEETDLSIGQAARMVGWADPRVASARFYRRFGLTPSRFRLSPHPRSVGDGGCDSCVRPRSS